jgi:hypothetical protein
VPRVDFLKRFIALCLVLCFPVVNLQAEELSLTDRELLNKIERDSLQYFIRLSYKTTGLTRDSSRPGSPASIAATGFALAAVAIGHSRGWISDQHAEDQLTKTLKTLLYKAEHKNGFFYHFLDVQTGKRVWNSEASSIDTALLVAGALLAAQYFPGTPIEKMAREIYDRIEWRWMMNNTMLMCMGWKPETGFLPYYWDTYNEHLILQALAIGSSTHPISANAWDEWLRNEDIFNDKRIIYSYSGSLFTYQFPQAFIDFRQLDDSGIDYAENSRLASLANREYTLAEQEKYKSYTNGSWGLSASVGPGGYKAYGGKPGEGLHDGTIAPYAAVSSIVFTPEESLEAIRYFYSLGQNLYGNFGFKDAFNLDKNWWAGEYLGIDQGISVLMLENYLNDGIVWKKFMALKEIQHWIEKCKLAKKPKVLEGKPAEAVIPAA